MGEWDDATTRDASHALPSWYTTLMGNRADTDQVVSKRASVTCIVDSSSTLDSQKVQNCPDPTCQATDHHDSSLSCDVPRVMMISKSASNDASHATSYVSTSNHWRHSYTNLRGSNERWEHAGDDRIASTGGWDSADDASTQATSRDNVKYAGCTPTSPATAPSPSRSHSSSSTRPCPSSASATRVTRRRTSPRATATTCWIGRSMTARSLPVPGMPCGTTRTLTSRPTGTRGATSFPRSLRTRASKPTTRTLSTNCGEAPNPPAACLIWIGRSSPEPLQA